MAATIADVMNYFGRGEGGLTAWRAEWAALTPEDKEQLKTGIDNGTLTY